MIIKTKELVQFTRNLFGPIEEISGKVLMVLEKNRDGDCLCIFTGSMGVNIVDVDHRDIAIEVSRK